jgi:glycosyltransferase involved in cell wall biosynthesis
MRILLVHPNFPAQLRSIGQYLAGSPSNEVCFLTAKREYAIKGIRKVVYSPRREPSKNTHRYLLPFERSVLHGQAACQSCIDLKKDGFVPDIILGHAGWGTTLFLKDVFPDTPTGLVFEWYYNSRGSDADFDPAEPLTVDDDARIRIKNATLLADLASCDGGLVPTHYQYSQFPSNIARHLTVSHEGIDLDFFRPDPHEKFILPGQSLDLSLIPEVVTYATRGMEPYRGFPQFIEAAYILQQMRPAVHVVIGGEDRVAYGRPAGPDMTYKQMMLEKFPLDPKRTHFVGSLPLSQYRTLLRCSSVHVYLTRPFVLSWSLLEAMACGAIVVASNTEPVREVVSDSINGLLVDFFSPEEIAAKIDLVLRERSRFEHLRRNARMTVAGRYDLKSCVRQRVDWLRDLRVSSR